MKVILINEKKAKLTPTGGRIKDIRTGATYSEVVVPAKWIHRFTDADSVQYEEVSVDTLPEDVVAIFDQVLQLIVGLASKYDALTELKSLPQINITTLFGLANTKGVTDVDMQALIMQVVMLKTDIEARLPRSWYDLWNSNLKPYIIEKLATNA